MLALHGSPDDIRENVFYLHNPSHDQIRTAQQWAQENHPDIVVLDGLAESMAAVGSDENKAADVLGFFRETLRPFAEAGAAVVIADHVTKSSENRGQFARGSGAKAGRYDGVSYEVAPAMQYTPTQAGFVRLKIQKDRNGGAGPRGKIVAELHFTPGVDGRTITAFRQPEQSEGPFRPTVYMEKIVKHIELYGTSTQSNLRKVGGKSQYIDKAIEVLLNEKTIGFHKVGQSHQYFLITPKGGGVRPFQPCSMHVLNLRSNPVPLFHPLRSCFRRSSGGSPKAFCDMRSWFSKKKAFAVHLASGHSCIPRNCRPLSRRSISERTVRIGRAIL